MAFPDISLRDNGTGTFDIALSDGDNGSTGNSNFFIFFRVVALFFFGVLIYLR
jgi:hypothetical protein